MADLAVSSPPPRSPTDLFNDPIDSPPLWFNKSAFLHPSFDPESYISDLRSFVPFDTLRSHLRAHLSSLNHDLVDLINRDYADFVSLSTKLIDIDGAVARMRSPLADLRDKIAQFRANVEASLAALQNGLQQRKEASEAREILELLLDTFHILSKVSSRSICTLGGGYWHSFPARTKGILVSLLLKCPPVHTDPVIGALFCLMA